MPSALLRLFFLLDFLGNLFLNATVRDQPHQSDGEVEQAGDGGVDEGHTDSD